MLKKNTACGPNVLGVVGCSGLKRAATKVRGWKLWRVELLVLPPDPQVDLDCLPRVVNPSCSPVCLLPPSPHHHTSRRSLARGQTHLCTPSPLPPPCLHQGLLLLHQPLNDQDHLRLRKPALAAIFRPRGYFGCVEFIKSLRRAIFERGGGRVSKIVLEDGNSGRGGRSAPASPQSGLLSRESWEPQHLHHHVFLWPQTIRTLCQPPGD